MRLVAAATAVTACLAFTGCRHADDPGGPERAEGRGAARSGVLDVAGSGETAATWVAETRVRLADGTTLPLASAPNANMIATLAPLAVPNRDRTAIAYNTWRGRRPMLRVRDLAKRRETALDEGAHSVSWAADGRFAYFKALEPDLRDPRRYLGHVVVRASARASARRWTARPGRYVVAAWARGRILAYRLKKSFPDLLVLDRPGRQRVLAPGSALVAVSPDGRRAFVTRYAASPPLVRVLDLASGAEIARLRVDAGHPTYVVESGSWVGDLVFAPATTGIAVFRVGDDIALAQMLRTGAALGGGPLLEARATPDGRRVVAWGELPSRPRQAIPDAALVDCDRLTLRCVRAAVGSSAAPPRPVYNPSRP